MRAGHRLRARALTKALFALLHLQGEGLAFAYRSAAPLFSDLPIAVAEREIACRLGDSGCGKATLLRVLAQLERPAASRARLGGAQLATPHPRVALVFQQPSLPPWLNVPSNVGFGLDVRHQPELAAPGARRAWRRR